MGHTCIIQGCKSEWYPGCGIKFHFFPKDSSRRKLWLSIVPVKSSFYENAKICSLHFKKSDYRGKCLLQTANPLSIEDMMKYEQTAPGPRLIVGCDSDEETGVVLQPKDENSTLYDKTSQVLMCRGCFATDIKLFDLESMDMKNTFEEFVGITKVEEVPHCLCSCCASLLVKFKQFRDRCRRAETLMQELREENMLNAPIVKSIDRPFYHLNSNMTISKTTFVQTDTVLQKTNLNETDYTVLIENEIKIKLEGEEREQDDFESENDDFDKIDTFGHENEPVKIKIENNEYDLPEYAENSNSENPVYCERSFDTVSFIKEEPAYDTDSTKQAAQSKHLGLVDYKMISRGSDTDCEYESDAPGPPTKKRLRTEIVHEKCVTTYSEQDFRPAETQSIENESRRNAYNYTMADQPRIPIDLTDQPLPSRSNVFVEVQDVAASTSATLFTEPLTISARKSKAEKQREYRQRKAASRTPAQAIAARKSNAERQRNYRLRKAANSF